MNREIKFRARITGTDSFIVGLPYSVYGNGIDSIRNESGTEYIDIDTLVEFTGLKDDCNVDIYEDDVVYLSGYGNYTVIFPFIELYEASYESDIGSIIGNIHENKELL